MTTKERILLESKAWLVEKLSLNNNYFHSLRKTPKPNILWIGSSDNLISIREVTNTEPGELIVHRNIAAQVRTGDINLMATLEDAIDAGIEYIIVCGSSNCKGIREVVQGIEDQVYMREWLDDLLELYNEHVSELEPLPQVEQEKRLCELSIKEQLLKLSELDIVQQAWERKSSPILLGWYFDLETGTIKELFSMTARQSIKQVASVI
ncbi:MAG TPA: carbonic anhydrase [Chryseolinea sp.]|nr:carbonic anhydrase [Chryseolinea sp.]